LPCLAAYTESTVLIEPGKNSIPLLLVPFAMIFNWKSETVFYLYYLRVIPYNPKQKQAILFIFNFYQ
jgi:hypothetical protein